ncbi:hypothetical protein RSAG8_13995, partial [Rhizoctonia solani AG-8 WAC10335]
MRTTCAELTPWVGAGDYQNIAKTEY